MMKIILFVLASILLASCKKEYMCSCQSPGSHKVYTFNGPKSDATAQCDAKYKYPFSETTCELYWTYLFYN